MPTTKYLAEGTSLQTVADAIRTKTGDSGQLEFPAGFVSAIDSISGGGKMLRVYSGDSMVSLPWTVEDERITETMEVVNWYVGQGQMPDRWTVNTSNGSLTVTGALISPRTRITLWLAETER